MNRHEIIVLLVLVIPSYRQMQWHFDEQGIFESNLKYLNHHFLVQDYGMFNLLFHFLTFYVLCEMAAQLELMCIEMERFSKKD